MAAEIATVSRTGKTAAAVAFSSRVWYTGQKHAMGAMTMLQDLAFGRLDNHYEDLCPDKRTGSSASAAAPSWCVGTNTMR